MAISLESKKALILVDIQQDYFKDGAFPLPSMEAAAKKAAELLSWARNNKLKIIHIRHEELDPDTTFLGAGTPGTTIDRSVAPIDGEVIVTKHFPNAFRESSLRENLKEIKELIFCGAMSNMCIDATARAAFDFGYNIIIAHDACAACALEFGGISLSSDQVHAAFMGPLAAAYGKVLSSDELISDVP